MLSVKQLGIFNNSARYWWWLKAICHLCHTFNPSTPEAEPGGTCEFKASQVIHGVPGQPGLQSKTLFKKKDDGDNVCCLWHGIRIQLRYRNNSNIHCAKETKRYYRSCGVIMGWSSTKKGSPAERRWVTSGVYRCQIRSSQQDPVRGVLPVTADPTVAASA